MRCWTFTLALAAAMIAVPGTALASWQGNGSGSGYSHANTMPAGSTPSASVSGRNVAVSWSAVTLPGGAPVGGYLVKRYDTGGTEQTIGASCSGTVSGTSCTEAAVPPGSWKYTVTPALGSWRGAESAQSSTVTVGSPTLSVSPTTVTSLPTTLTGQITNFITGQTVSFRLDDPSTGQSLSGSITPSTVPSNGTASVSVTIPAAVLNGSHTVYAIGDQGDTAGAVITVAVPTTVSTSAWSISDQSSGTATNVTDPYAVAGDSRFDVEIGFPASFDTNRYLAFDYGSPLPSGPAGNSIAGVNFNFTFLGTDSTGGVAANTCFYFDVRSISTGTVLATHGSGASPVSCTNALTFQTVSTALPEVDTTDKANDLEIRVYLTNASGPTGITAQDQATVTGTEGASNDSFTLYRNSLVNRASGTSTTNPWSLSSIDNVFLTSGTGWDNAPSASKYLQFTFPPYVPTGSTSVSATFKHTYRASNSGRTTCYYFEVYQGATLLATHGSTSSPYTYCNSSTSFVTDTVSLPEVNTVARANNVVIRIHATTTGTSATNRKSDHDLAQLQLTYTHTP